MSCALARVCSSSSPCVRGAAATWNCQLGLAGRGGRVWAAAMAAAQPWLVRRLAGASGGDGSHGAAAIVEVHSRTLECVGAATYDALLRLLCELVKSLRRVLQKFEPSPPAPPRVSIARTERWRREERADAYAGEANCASFGDSHIREPTPRAKPRRERSFGLSGGRAEDLQLWRCLCSSSPAGWTPPSFAGGLNRRQPA